MSEATPESADPNVSEKSLHARSRIDRFMETIAAVESHVAREHRESHSSAKVSQLPVVTETAGGMATSTGPEAISRVLGLPVHNCRKAAHAHAADSRKLNILFVLPGDFASNNALHVVALTRHLGAAGHRCFVVAEPPIETLKTLGEITFEASTHAEAMTTLPVFANGSGPDIVHAWTTRDNVRKVCEPILAASGVPLVVHMEDNEWQILSSTLGRTIEELRNLTPAEADALLPWNLSHPGIAERFLARATGATLVVDRLVEFLPDGMPSLTIWPAADERYFFPRPRPDAFRDSLGFDANHTVLFYHGNVHAANVAEMRALYEAVAVLNETGTPATLLRTGENHCPFPGNLAPRVAGCILELGRIKHHRLLPDLMAIADVFVQPGESGPFNDYRFPSKLPEFFSIGRPVILPRTNLGAALTHGRDAYVLERGDSASIAEAVRAIRRDPQLADRLTRGATAFAETHFSWARNARRLAAFYRETLARSRAR